MACLFRFCYVYDGPELIEIAPLLLNGQKIHYPIFHDETCVHANDQANFVWMREGEQPLRDKSRGRIVHVSDFIVEHCGRLLLTAVEIEAQMKLPLRPLPPSENPPLPPGNQPTTTKGRAKKAKNTKKAGIDGRNYTDHQNEWIPPPPPAPFKSYRLSSFDARRIIYPGANYDPWWDMPQLIAQVSHIF